MRRGLATLLGSSLGVIRDITHRTGEAASRRATRRRRWSASSPMRSHKARQPPPIKLEEEEGATPPPPATEEEMAPRNLWQTTIISKMQKLTKKVNQWTDERLSLMNEVLAATDTVKCYAWEQIFQSKVQEIRDDELSWFRKA